jgi:hypothetical protein
LVAILQAPSYVQAMKAALSRAMMYFQVPRPEVSTGTGTPKPVVVGTTHTVSAPVWPLVTLALGLILLYVLLRRRRRG